VKKIVEVLSVTALLLAVAGCDEQRTEGPVEIATSALTVRLHAEAQSWTASLGDNVSASAASVRFVADAVGDFFQFSSAAPAGRYDLTLRFARRNVYGDYALYVGGARIATVLGFADDRSDEWNTVTFTNLALSSGATITFSVTGRATAATDYDFKIDYLDLVEAAGGAPGTGGTPLRGTAGATGTGGFPNSGMGGATSTGGQTATGGVTAAGGGMDTGGMTGSGGATAAGGAGGSHFGPCVPVNPKATQQAKNLLCYLHSQFGNHVLSGQQETSWNNPAGDVAYYTTNIGKAPAILGGDYLYPNGTSARAIAYWNAGGIPMIRYHMGAPPNGDSYQSSMGSANLDRVVTPGTPENTSFNAKLDYAAAEIQKLQTAGVPLIWAPFHEVQANGWFWWSKGSGAQYVALWKYMYTYFTSTKHLDNVLWLVPFSGSPNSAYYPGKDFADIAGPDTYSRAQPFAGTYNSARGVVGVNIPIALHETGTIPQPAGMFPSAAPWLLFNVWAGFETSANTLATTRSAYLSPYTITRADIPDLK
jgi:Glycosyl hydrolase family 26